MFGCKGRWYFYISITLFRNSNLSRAAFSSGVAFQYPPYLADTTAKCARSSEVTS